MEQAICVGSCGVAETEASFELAKELVMRDWDAELARLDIMNGRMLEIETGNKDWDATLALAQKAALGMFIGPTEHLPHRSFVFSRQPDQGYSPRGDGNDYTHMWNGQSAMEADFLISLILPSVPGLAKDVFKNFLATQTQKGYIDWKPGLGGQRGRMLATPLLTNSAWRIYQATEDRRFLEMPFLIWFPLYRAGSLQSKIEMGMEFLSGHTPCNQDTRTIPFFLNGILGHKESTLRKLKVLPSVLSLS